MLLPPQVTGRARRIAGEPERWTAHNSAMRIDQIGRRAGPGRWQLFFSFQLPPKTELGERTCCERARRAAQAEPSFVSVTYGAGASTRDKTIEIVKHIRAIGSR